MPTRVYATYLIKHKQLHLVDAERAAVDHVEHTAGCANDDVHTVLKTAHVIADVGATDARHTLDVHVVAE